MSDSLYDWQKIKLLTLVDDYTRNSLLIEVDWRLRGYGVVPKLMKVAQNRVIPKSIRIDNDMEFI